MDAHNKNGRPTRAPMKTNSTALHSLEKFRPGVCKGNYGFICRAKPYRVCRRGAAGNFSFSRVTRQGLGVFCPDVTTTEAIELLEKFRAGKVSVADALAAFQAPPVTDLGFAQVDAHRALRKGFPEVIYGGGKTSEQIVRIAAKIAEREERLLITR